MKRSLFVMLGLALLGAMLAACGRAEGELSAQPTDASAAPTASATAGDFPVVDPNEVPTFDPADMSAISAEGYQVEMTGYELLAEAAGNALYSGQFCLVSLAGCVCEEGFEQDVFFRFEDDAHMSVTFSNDLFTSTWAMERVGPNHWNNTIPIVDDESGEFRGNQFSFITFTETGYIMTTGIDAEGGMNICPDMTFDRVGAVSGEDGGGE